MISIGGGELLILLLGLLFLLAIGGLIAAGIWLATRKQDTSRAGGDPQRLEDPLHILRQRYARGEITKEEFQEMRQDLTL